MSDVVWDEAPSLRDPLLILAYEGWFDAGSAATGAVNWLRDRYDAARVAAIDADEFFDFTQQRPEVRFDDGGQRRIEWPRNEVHAVEVDDHDRDILLLAGVEPHLQWRRFCDAVVEIVRDTRCTFVVTLGAMVAGVPHTRPARVQGSSANDDLAVRLGLDKPTYEGPTGIVGSLHERLDREGLPGVSLRVGIPHYVAGPPNPKGTRALLQRLELTTGLPTSYSDLDASVLEWEERVTQAVASDEDIANYVVQLEHEYDRAQEADLPTGDDLAAEFQRFLRDQE